MRRGRVYSRHNAEPRTRLSLAILRAPISLRLSEERKIRASLEEAVREDDAQFLLPALRAFTSGIAR
jgi:hypothetical protein